MNWAHLHLVLIHIPVVGLGCGLVVLSMALLKDNPEFQKIGLGILVLTAVLTIPVYITGEPAEELIEDFPGISEALIDRHAEVARFTLLATGILGVLALGGLIRFRQSLHLPRIFVTLLLLLALGVSGALAWTASLGGQINHPEIQARLTAPPSEEHEANDRWDGKQQRHQDDDRDDD